MVSVPPSGMASRALTARLSRASSIWLASAEAGGKSGRQVEGDFDGRAERAVQQVVHAAHQLGEIGRPRLQRLAPGKGQQALRQGGAALGALRGAVEQAVGGGIVRQPLAQQLEIAEHRGQQVVEVVRHAAGELADQFQLLQLAQLLLGAGALGDLRQQLVMGMLELGGALLDPALELVVDLLQPAARPARRSSSSERVSCWRRRPLMVARATLIRVVGWNGRSMNDTLPRASSQRAAMGLRSGRRRGRSPG